MLCVCFFIVILNPSFPVLVLAELLEKYHLSLLTNGSKLGVLTQNIKFVRQSNVKMYREEITIMHKVVNGRVLDL